MDTARAVETTEVLGDAVRIWRQQEIPVVFDDRNHKRLLVKLPYRPTNGAWLRAQQHHRPEWLGTLKCWRIPRAWLEDVIHRLCLRWGHVYFIHPYRTRETCAPVCWEAQGLVCQCSCLGANHGQGAQDGWYIVSETCAITWSQRKYACRLLRVRTTALLGKDVE